MCERCYGNDKEKVRKNRNARKRYTRKLVYCNNCNTPLKGWDRVYPIHVSSVNAPLSDIERWKEQGYDIIFEQQQPAG